MRFCHVGALPYGALLKSGFHPKCIRAPAVTTWNAGDCIEQLSSLFPEVPFKAKLFACVALLASGFMLDVGHGTMSLFRAHSQMAFTTQDSQPRARAAGSLRTSLSAVTAFCRYISMAVTRGNCVLTCALGSSRNRIIANTFKVFH